MIGGERQRRADFTRKRPFFGKYTAFQGVEYDISSKMDAIDNCNSIAHVNKGAYFFFPLFFSLFWIKKWDAF